MFLCGFTPHPEKIPTSQITPVPEWTRGTRQLTTRSTETEAQQQVLERMGVNVLEKKDGQETEETALQGHNLESKYDHGPT